MEHRLTSRQGLGEVPQSFAHVRTYFQAGATWSTSKNKAAELLALPIADFFMGLSGSSKKSSQILNELVH